MAHRPYQTSHPWIRSGSTLTGRRPAVVPAGAGRGLLRAGFRGPCCRPLPPRGSSRRTSSRGRRRPPPFENNTLTEEQVAQVLDGTLDLPPSRTYLAQEVRNMLDAFASIHSQIEGGAPPRLTPDWIAGANRRVLEGLEEQLGEGVVPGEVPAFPVGVGRYLGAPRRTAATC